MLALATLDKPNLLILDEPTNHLDIDARNELLTALNDFDGAVILVSHDRRLIEATADRLLLVSNGHVTPFEGDLDDYRRFLLVGRQRAGAAREPEVKATKEVTRRSAAEKRQTLKPLKDKVDAAESQIAALTVGTRQAGQGAVRSPDLHPGPRQGCLGVEEARRCRPQASGSREGLAGGE